MELFFTLKKDISYPTLDNTRIIDKSSPGQVITQV